MSYADGQWHHVVSTRAGTTFTLYLDAGVVASTTVSNNGTYYCCDSTIGIAKDGICVSPASLKGPPVRQ